MAVQGALRGDLRLVYQAIAHDLLTAAMLSLAEIKVTVNELFAQNREYLRHFQYFEV